MRFVAAEAIFVAPLLSLPKGADTAICLFLCPPKCDRIRTKIIYIISTVFILKGRARRDKPKPDEFLHFRNHLPGCAKFSTGRVFPREMAVFWGVTVKWKMSLKIFDGIFLWKESKNIFFPLKERNMNTEGGVTVRALPSLVRFLGVRYCKP